MKPLLVIVWFVEFNLVCVAVRFYLRNQLGYVFYLCTQSVTACNLLSHRLSQMFMASFASCHQIEAAGAFLYSCMAGTPSVQCRILPSVESPSSTRRFHSL